MKEILLSILLLAGAKHHSDEVLCLAQAIYHEARGETLEGQLKVARVILNRSASSKFPNTICKVVAQPAQFPWYNYRTNIKELTAWKQSLRIANFLLNSNHRHKPVYWFVRSDLAGKLSWMRQLKVHETVGNHTFYKERT